MIVATALSLNTSPVPCCGPTKQYCGGFAPCTGRNWELLGSLSGIGRPFSSTACGSTVVVGPGGVVTGVVVALAGVMPTVVTVAAAVVAVAATVVDVLVELMARPGPGAAVVLGTVEPGTVVPGTVVSPATVVVVGVRSSVWHWLMTGRRYTWPVTCTKAIASFWFSTPGRLTTIASP